MSQDHQPPLQQAVEIDASPARVWSLISDLRRMPEWSPQVDSTQLTGGAERVTLGIEFTNDNSHGPLRWETHGRVVRFEPEREVAFRIEENWVVWSFRLEPTPDGGTRLVQRREAPDGISPLSLELTDAFMGGQEVFTNTMREGMSVTLQAIKDAAEESVRPTY